MAARYELWESAGTPATTLLHEVTPDSFPEYAFISDLTPFRPADHSVLFRNGGWIYFARAGLESAEFLHELSQQLPVHDESLPFAVVESVGLFFDAEAFGSCALWRTDGTPTGTERVVGVGSGLRGLCPEEVVVLGAMAYFTACTVEHGCELFRTDGTVSGTERVTDQEPGLFSFSPTALVAIDGHLYFSGCTTGQGCEPWISDGTAGGTYPVGDLNPGLASSDPSGFTAAQSRIYFSADDGGGEEPWVMSGALFADGFESGDASRWSSVAP